MRTVRQQDVPSLIGNGAFGAGTAGWRVDPGVTHVEFEQGTAGSAALVNAPQYGVSLPAGAAISRTWSRSDLYRYPSRRFLSDVLALPGGVNTYFLLLSATTRLDGRAVINNGPPDPMFWAGPASDPTTIKVGAQIEVRDVGRDEVGGAWRVGRLRGSFLPGGEVLEASPIERTLPRLTTSADYAGATYTYVHTDGRAYATILGTHTFARTDGLGGGFQPGDVLVITAPTFALMRIESATFVSARWSLLLQPLFGTGGGAEIAPPLADTGGAVSSFTDWFAAPPTLLDLSRDLPLFQYDFTLAFNYFPAPFDGTTALEFVDRAGAVLAAVPMWSLGGAVPYEDLSTGNSAAAATVMRRRLVRFFTEQPAPVGSRLRLTIRAGTRPALIGDVVLHRGDFTRRHDFDDRDDPEIVEPPDRRSALDRLFHGLDASEGTVPRGTVVLYVGGGVCPSGWKRVDAPANSATDGLERLPPPDAAVFDPDRGRTRLTWLDASFDALDADGAAITIPDTATTASLALPNVPPFNGAYEAVALGPTRQRVQPGMSLRVKMSNLSADEYAYAAVVSRAYVAREEVVGPAPTAWPATEQLTYPLFLRGNNFDPPERAWTPIGPDKTQQPTTFTPEPSALPGGPIFGGAPAGPPSFSGLVNGANLMTITGVPAGLAVGKLTFVRWTSGANPATALSGAFVGEVMSVVGATVTVRRYDGRGMVVYGAGGPRSGTATLSDAKVFHPSILLTRTLVNGEPMWSARRFSSECVVEVAGDVVGDVTQYNDDGLVLEPSGYVRYLPGGGFDVGSGGHSHEIVRGDATYNENVAPHVNSGHESLPPTSVARRHGHGYMPGFVHPLPPFFAGLLCEKL